MIAMIMEPAIKERKTPMKILRKYEKEIADELREKGIHNYLFFSEYPYGVDVYGDWERMEWNFKNRIEKYSANMKRKLQNFTISTT